MEKWLDLISRTVAGCALLLFIIAPILEEPFKLFLDRVIKKIDWKKVGLIFMIMGQCISTMSNPMIMIFLISPQLAQEIFKMWLCFLVIAMLIYAYKIISVTKTNDGNVESLKEIYHRAELLNLMLFNFFGLFLYILLWLK